MKSLFLSFNCFVYYSTHFCRFPLFTHFISHKLARLTRLTICLLTSACFLSYPQTQDKNMPTFSNLGKNWYSDIVPENIELHSPLSVQIQASSPMSRKLIYSIVKGNEMEEFTVDFNTGMLRLLLTLYFRRFLLLPSSFGKFFEYLLYPRNSTLRRKFHITKFSTHPTSPSNVASLHHALIVTLIFPYPIPLWLILRHSYSLPFIV